MLVAAAELALAALRAARVATVLHAVVRVVLFVAEAALALTAFTLAGPITASAGLATALAPSGPVVGTHIVIVVAPPLSAPLALVAITIVAPGSTLTVVVAEPSSPRLAEASARRRAEATIGTIEPLAVRTRTNGTPRHEHTSAVRADPEAPIESVAYDAHVGDDTHAGELRRADGGRLRRRDRRAAHRGRRYQQMKPSHVMPFEGSNGPHSSVRSVAFAWWACMRSKRHIHPVFSPMAAPRCAKVGGRHSGPAGWGALS